MLAYCGANTEANGSGYVYLQDMFQYCPPGKHLRTASVYFVLAKMPHAITKVRLNERRYQHQVDPR